MGAGNFAYTKHVKDQQAVYVNYADYEDADGNIIEDTSAEWEMMVDVIRSLLPESFNWSYESSWFEPDDDWKGEGERIAFNSRVNIVLKDSDNSIATLGVIVDEDCSNAGLAMAYIDAFSTKLFDKLSAHYELRVRVCGWSSKSYTPSHLKVA